MQPATASSREPLTTSKVVSLPGPVTVWEASWSVWWPRVVRVVILLLTDMTALLLAMSVGYVLWAGPILAQPPTVFVSLLPLLLLVPLGYAGAGLYPGFGVGAVDMLRRLSCCTSFAFLTLITTGFIFNLTPRYSRVGFAIAWGLSVVAVPSFRFLVVAVVGRWQRWREPAVLVGNARWVQRAVQTFSKTPSLGYRPVGILSRELGVQTHPGGDIPVLRESELAPYLAAGGVHVALVSEDAAGRPPLRWLQEHFRCVVMVQEEGDLPVELVRVCNLGGILGIEFRNNLLRWHNRFIKRLLDVVLGSLCLLIAAPLIAVGGLLVKLSSRGPIFFAQQREGVGGRPITVWKLRTMFQDAEQRLEECLAANPALRDEWATHFKLAHDPRVIPGIGPLLRRCSVDELPQLWSVVKGEMSLVGPRPFPVYHLRHFPPEFRALRQRVRPGLTGMWQVIVRSNGSIEEQQVYDTYYIRNWSIGLDYWILLQTLGVVLRQKGAY